MYKGKYVLGIIPARGGSKGILKKNRRPLAGKPLIAYTIEEAKKSKYLDRTIVSTDDKEIAEVAKQYGGDLPFMRPKELAKDDTPMLPVLQHAVKEIEKLEKRKVDIIVHLDPTAPFRNAEDIDNCIKQVIEQDCESVETVTEAERNPYFNMVELDEKKRIRLVVELKNPPMRRQDAPKVYNETSGVYASKRSLVMEKNTLMGKDTRAFIVPEDRAGHIDSQLEFEFCDYLMKKKQGITESSIFDLKGKVVIITGGAGHLGTHFANVLSEAGANVVIGDLEQKKCSALAEELKKKYNKDPLGLQLDLAKKDSVTKFVDAVFTKYKRIDVLINNAMRSELMIPFENYPIEDWEKVMAVNITGMFLMAQAVIPIMVKQNSGSIINISSIYGIVGPTKEIYEGTKIHNPVVYSVSKGGVVMLTKWLATMYGDKNIRTNTLTSGGVSEHQHGGNEFEKKYSKKVPMKRMTRLNDLTGPILLLASDASSYINGHNLVVDGGWSAW